MKKITLLGSSLLAVLALATFLFYQSCTPDPCKDVVCANSGTCTDGNCNCPIGYEGTTCATLSRAKMIKAWNVSSNSCAGSGGWQVTVTAGTGDLGLQLANFSHLTCLSAGLTVNATMTGENTFNIPSQVLCSGDITISGTGTISGSNLNITYTYQSTIGNGTCTEVYN